jgi:hypothetical protein
VACLHFLFGYFSICCSNNQQGWPGKISRSHYNIEVEKCKGCRWILSPYYNIPGVLRSFCLLIAGCSSTGSRRRGPWAADAVHRGTGADPADGGHDSVRAAHPATWNGMAFCVRRQCSYLFCCLQRDSARLATQNDELKFRLKAMEELAQMRNGEERTLALLWKNVCRSFLATVKVNESTILPYEWFSSQLKNIATIFPQQQQYCWIPSISRLIMCF